MAQANEAGGPTAVERGVKALIAEAREQHDPALVRTAQVALRTGSSANGCRPSLADRVAVAVLPQYPVSTIHGTIASGGLVGFRRGAIAYYAAHFGSGESPAQIECVTTSGGLYEHLGELENFMYLLDAGNAQARRVLAQLRQDCRAEGL